uniref:Uncharacterized protein n=1 Tax=Candidatus Kentrum sp. LPFa TaxID=2126335 RepID=A0A450WW56_9GAMM|nr:MAG: hypothetical protein BECKLPF1236A_GA0070988_102964 [Candidatus Kentron sp. LPFa]VFK34711.1 MAG: hypothetical protein BECKLPF1236C_GA0070990_102934 [Candidatus Kentron sp. LPFa]
MLVDISVLEKATSAVFQHLRENGINSIDLDKDFYWNIEKEQKYDPYQEPTEMNLGQLADDLKEIEKIASGDGDVIGYALVWIAALYQYIGEANPG